MKKMSFLLILITLSFSTMAKTKLAPLACEAIRNGIHLLEEGYPVDNDLGLCRESIDKCEKIVTFAMIKENKAIASLGSSCDCYIHIKINKKAQVYGQVTSCL